MHRAVSIFMTALLLTQIASYSFNEIPPQIEWEEPMQGDKDWKVSGRNSTSGNNTGGNNTGGNNTGGNNSSSNNSSPTGNIYITMYGYYSLTPSSYSETGYWWPSSTVSADFNSSNLSLNSSYTMTWGLLSGWSTTQIISSGNASWTAYNNTSTESVSFNLSDGQYMFQVYLYGPSGNYLQHDMSFIQVGNVSSGNNTGGNNTGGNNTGGNNTGGNNTGGNNTGGNNTGGNNTGGNYTSPCGNNPNATYVNEYSPYMVMENQSFMVSMHVGCQIYTANMVLVYWVFDTNNYTIYSGNQSWIGTNNNSNFNWSVSGLSAGNYTFHVEIYVNNTFADSDSSGIYVYGNNAGGGGNNGNNTGGNNTGGNNTGGNYTSPCGSNINYTSVYAYSPYMVMENQSFTTSMYVTCEIYNANMVLVYWIFDTNNYTIYSGNQSWTSANNSSSFNWAVNGLSAGYYTFHAEIYVNNTFADSDNDGISVYANNTGGNNTGGNNSGGNNTGGNNTGGNNSGGNNTGGNSTLNDGHCLILSNLTMTQTYFVTLYLVNTCNNSIHYPGINASASNPGVYGINDGWWYMIGGSNSNLSYHQSGYQLSFNQSIQNGTWIYLYFEATVLNCGQNNSWSHQCPNSTLSMLFQYNPPSNSGGNNNGGNINSTCGTYSSDISIEVNTTQSHYNYHDTVTPFLDLYCGVWNSTYELKWGLINQDNGSLLQSGIKYFNTNSNSVSYHPTHSMHFNENELDFYYMETGNYSIYGHFSYWDGLTNQSVGNNSAYFSVGSTPSSTVCGYNSALTSIIVDTSLVYYNESETLDSWIEVECPLIDASYGLSISIYNQNTSSSVYSSHNWITTSMQNVTFFSDMSGIYYPFELLMQNLSAGTYTIYVSLDEYDGPTYLQANLSFYVNHLASLNLSTNGNQFEIGDTVILEILADHLTYWSDYEVYYYVYYNNINGSYNFTAQSSYNINNISFSPSYNGTICMYAYLYNIDNSYTNYLDYESECVTVGSEPTNNSGGNNTGGNDTGGNNTGWNNTGGNNTTGNITWGNISVYPSTFGYYVGDMVYFSIESYYLQPGATYEVDWEVYKSGQTIDYGIYSWTATSTIHQQTGSTFLNNSGTHCVTAWLNHVDSNGNLQYLSTDTSCFSVSYNYSDMDNDGIDDSIDNCLNLSNPDQSDMDGDGIGDACEYDSDNDGVIDDIDNCLNQSNTNQSDIDGDGIGDICDSDIDGDGVSNGNDVFPYDGNESGDFDGDGIGDNADPDDDNDGMTDVADVFPYDSSEQIDTDGDGIGNNADTDDDGDGITDVLDNCQNVPNPDQQDLDGDGIGSACDGIEDTVPDATDGNETDGASAIPALGAVGTLLAVTIGFIAVLRREEE